MNGSSLRKLIIGSASSDEGVGADFTEELKIKWKIDDNYTFTSFTPKRVVRWSHKETDGFLPRWMGTEITEIQIMVSLFHFFMCRTTKAYQHLSMFSREATKMKRLLKVFLSLNKKVGQLQSRSIRRKALTMFLVI